MVINLLDDEDFEHHNGIVGFLRPTLLGMQRTKDLLERFPTDEFIDARGDVFWKILTYGIFAHL